MSRRQVLWLQGNQFAARLTVYPDLRFFFIHLKRRKKAKSWGQIRNEENGILYGKVRAGNSK
jgi:hypothetical protein